MTKIIITILAIYLFYYAGNIIYDLYFKKDNSEKKEEIEEFSLNEFAENNNDKVQDIRIDDVENINVPSSFNSKELSIIKQEQDESRDLSYFRKKFESEEDIDAFYLDDKNTEEHIEQNELSAVSTEETVPQEKPAETTQELPKTYHEKFFHILNLAETSVQLISNKEGHKVYHSMI